LRVTLGDDQPELGIYSNLRYKLSKFDLNGNFLGFEDLDS
jgi:hypothetical protein